jgi:aerobic carbon-monoxide dehydrogenase medium subunit
MAMYPTRYHRPADLDDAVQLFSACEDATYLAGGHTLLPTLKQRLARPSDLIDLCVLPQLAGISLQDRVISIGATTRHADVAASSIVRRLIPALSGLAGSIGDRHVRHRGTIGGSVANNDPAADYPAAVLGLGATVVTNRHRIAADDYFVALYETALAPGEIITRIEFPIPATAGYAKFRSPASRYAIAAVFVSKSDAGVRIAVTGAGASGVFRPHDMERALELDFRAAAVAPHQIDPGLLLSDLNGTGEYRANLVCVLARRALDNLGEAHSYK